MRLGFKIAGKKDAGIGKRVPIYLGNTEPQSLMSQAQHATSDSVGELVFQFLCPVAFDCCNRLSSKVALYLRIPRVKARAKKW